MTCTINKAEIKKDCCESLHRIKIDSRLYKKSSDGYKKQTKV